MSTASITICAITSRAHSTVTNREDEYVRVEVNGLKVTTNTVESFFSLLKRSKYGIHHHMSRKYLAAY